MKKILFTFLLVTLSYYKLFPQNFTLEWKSQGFLFLVGDLDNDGISEFLRNGNNLVTVYDGATHQVKYTINGQGILDAYHQPSVNTNKLIFDFNGNNVKDIILTDISGNPLRIIDPSTGNKIFEFISSANYPRIGYIGDFNDDSFIDITLHSADSTYIYNTGQPITGLEASSNSSQLDDFILSQNFPNPFNPETQIQYSIATPGNYSLRIYNINGEIIKNIELSNNGPGSFTYTWNGENDNLEKVSSGRYIYQLVGDKFMSVRKMILLK